MSFFPEKKEEGGGEEEGERRERRKEQEEEEEKEKNYFNQAAKLEQAHPKLLRGFFSPQQLLFFGDP